MRSFLFSFFCVVINAEFKAVTTFQPESCESAKKAANSDWVYVHYVGKLADGTQFDASRERGYGKPLEFRLGGGKVIQGWERGVLGMCVGEKRTLEIPPELGYGANQVGPIPPHSTLFFDIELISIKPPSTRMDNSSRFLALGFIILIIVVLVWLASGDDEKPKVVEESEKEK